MRLHKCPGAATQSSQVPQPAHAPECSGKAKATLAIKQAQGSEKERFLLTKADSPVAENAAPRDIAKQSKTLGCINDVITVP
jgi:hypothetical protein